MVEQRSRIVAAVLLALLGFVACTSPTVAPAIVSVTINEGERSVAAGSTLALTATVETQGTATETVLWSSDEPDTATVSSTGVVTGVSAGEARITATSAIDASKSDTVTITVTPPPAAPDVVSVTIDAGERSMLVGETLPLSTTVVSVGGASEAVTWTSDDTETATVNAAGVVTGISVGEALITATSVYDPTKSDSTSVSVISVAPGAPARISVVTGDNQTAAVGSAVPIPPAVRVRDADNNPLQSVSVTFTVTTGGGTIAPSTAVTTNADGIATLSSWTLGTTAGSNGVRATVTGSDPAISATLSATAVPGPASPLTSTVTATPTSLPADGSATSQLTIQLKDAHGNNLTTGGATVTFATPTQGSIGTVTDNGNGTYTATYTAGTTAGNVTITPRISGVNFTNTTSIALSAAVLSVTIDQTDPTVRLGDTLQLTATVNAVGGASTALTWTSSNPSIATIHLTTGIVTSNAGGTTTIAATSTYDTTRRSQVTLTVPAPMILTVETNPYSTDTTVSLPLSGAVDVNIDWGDGTWTHATTGGIQSHTYTESGTYTVRIAGRLNHFGGVDLLPLAGHITDVSAWGDLGLISLSEAFYYRRNLQTLPPDLPPTVTDTSWMFKSTEYLGDPSTLSTWDVSNVTNMAGMFSGDFDDPAGINPDIGDWDVSNVTNMSSMFAYNMWFNTDIGDWDVSNVANMGSMFRSARLFDQDISRWDVSSVTNMSQMFESNPTLYPEPIFNQDISAWDVSNVTNMSWMFSGNWLFDQDISGWDVSSVTDARFMFSDASSFNQDLSGWCVSTIPAAPTGFDNGAANWTLPRPMWGTCPT